MSDHRIRLSDQDLELIVAALRSRAAMTRGARAHRLQRLAERLSELAPGNPMWRLSALSQEHELDPRELTGDHGAPDSQSFGVD